MKNVFWAILIALGAGVLFVLGTNWNSIVEITSTSIVDFVMSLFGL